MNRGPTNSPGVSLLNRWQIPLCISRAATNARLLRSTGLRSALSPSRRRPFHFATARSSRADYIAQTRALQLRAWLRRSTTSSVPVRPASESLRFHRHHPNRSASSGQRRHYQSDLNPGRIRSGLFDPPSFGKPRVKLRCNKCDERPSQGSHKSETRTGKRPARRKTTTIECRKISAPNRTQ